MKETKQAVYLPISQLHPFEGHPFKVQDNEEMDALVESIQSGGILTPLIVRPLDEKENEYEVISGHRRLHAAIKAGMETVPAFVTPMSRDAAAIALVDSNLHREHILPSEKAFAYKLKLEALNHQGVTSGQLGQKWTRDGMAESAEDSSRQIHRYIRLTNLIPGILEKVDEGRIALTPAVELSYLTETEQTDLLETMESEDCTPSLTQAIQLKQASLQKTLNMDMIFAILHQPKTKRSLGMKFTTSFKTNAKAVWSAGTVIRILKNPIYTGVLVQGKETTPSYKVHKRITKDESEWTVINDSHEAIISKIDFDSVQKVLKCDTRRSPDGKAVQLFSGMIFCGDCGASMVRKTVPAGEKKYVYYVCSAHKQSKSCSPHRMRDTVLEEIVLGSLKQHISEVVDMSELLAITDTAPLRTAQAQKVQRQLDKKHEEYEKLQKLLMSLYENLTDGIIDREEYTRLKASFTARADEAEKQMDALREQLDDIHNHGTENAWMNEFIKRQGLASLDRAVVVALIDKILIHSNDVVEIIYRWQDEFAWQLDILRSASLREVV